MWGPSAETIWNNPFTDFDLEYLPLRDPSYFLAGQIHKCPLEWDRLFNQSDMSNPDLMLVRQWIREGVDISALFCHYKGNFKGRSYNSPLPVSFYAPNIPVCQEFGSFIASTLEDRLQDGSLQLWGRVGEVSPPLVVMPIVIERSKPRMCHDERFLNLWIRDCPFTLDTLRHIPSLINHNVLMTTCDEKSAYDNVFIQERYRTYFGLQFGGYYMVYTTLPFGFKASPFIYQTIGMVVTSYLRQHGVPTLQYLDDRFLAAWEPKVTHTSGIKCASIAIYSTCQILSRLGYTLALHKSVIVPTNKLIFLGMHVDSKCQVFSLPPQKREKFALLRGAILQCENITQNASTVPWEMRFIYAMRSRREFQLSCSLAGAPISRRKLPQQQQQQRSQQNKTFQHDPVCLHAPIIIIKRNKQVGSRFWNRFLEQTVPVPEYTCTCTRLGLLVTALRNATSYIKMIYDYSCLKNIYC